MSVHEVCVWLNFHLKKIITTLLPVLLPSFWLQKPIEGGGRIKPNWKKFTERGEEREIEREREVER